MSDMTSIDIEAVRVDLAARREDILRVAAASESSRQPVELDQTRVGRLSRMDALQTQAMAIETARRRTIEVHRIDATLKRLTEGDYGYCATCGEEIAPKRLELDPATPVCINCASNGTGG